MFAGGKREDEERGTERVRNRKNWMDEEREREKKNGYRKHAF